MAEQAAKFAKFSGIAADELGMPSPHPPRCGSEGRRAAGEISFLANSDSYALQMRGSWFRHRAIDSVQHMETARSRANSVTYQTLRGVPFQNEAGP